MLVAQQSANDFPSHVEKHDVKVHDVVEVDPLAAMPKEMYIYLSSRTRITRTFYLRGLIVLTSVRFAVLC